MSYELFQELVDQCRAFPDKVKTIQFLKDGEPMLNKRLSAMIQYAKNSDKFERVEVITNGSLLSESMNLKLIDAGLDTIRISLQGVSEEKYHEISGVHIDIDFEEFVENIKHFYTNRKNCKVHLKIIDIGITDRGDEQAFYSKFGNICDELSIQHVLGKEFENPENIYGDKFNGCYVCSRPFISMSVSSDGSVMPCCRETTDDLVLGNIQTETLSDLWNCEQMRDVRMAHLNKQKDSYITCKECCLPDNITYESDNLDDHIDELSEKYGRE
jgi:radical SAM protein with 4Fe4S-binding SPASM domain